MKRIVSIILVAMLVVAAFTFVGCGTDNDNATTSNVSSPVVAFANSVTPLVANASYGFPSRLTFASASLKGGLDNSPILRSPGDEYPSTVTLTATVLPVEATNKEVDWSIAWDEAPTNGDKPVTDYVTVTPTADGSATAAVHCKKAFNDDTIAITVTTRIGGFKAQCVVSYIGAPTSMVISTTGTTITNDAGWNVDIANVYCGNTYNLDLILDNQYHQIGSTIDPEYTISVEGIGTFNMQQRTYSRYGLQIGGTSQANLAAFVNPTPASTQSITPYITCSIVGGKLRIVPGSVLSNLSSVTGTSQGSTGTYYLSLTDPSKVPYVKLTITETNSGLTAVINIRVQSDVSGVSLAPGTLGF